MRVWRSWFPARKSDVPQPQEAASDASQGNVAREKGAEEAKPRYVVHFINNAFDLEHLLNSSYSDGYDFVYFDKNLAESRFVIIVRRRD